MTQTRAEPGADPTPWEIVEPDQPAAQHPFKVRGRIGFARTLAGRLALGVVILVTVLVAVTGAATYAFLKPFLIDRLDQQLAPIAAGNALTVQQCIVVHGSASCVVDPTPSGPIAPKAAQREWINAFFANGGPALTFKSPAGTGDVVEMQLSAADKSWLFSHPGGTRTLTTTDGVTMRVSSRLELTPEGRVAVVTGLATEEVNHTLRRLLLLELAIGAAAIAMAAGLTIWGVRAGLRPLHRVTRTAQEVTAELGPDGEGLDRRVPHADPATEVGQVASSVNTLLEAVETEFAARVSSEDRMRQFLADASHELRTPLTSIRGYAELSRLQGQSPEDAKDTMRRIEVEGTRMSRLVEDLLVLARGDQDAPTRHDPVEIDDLLSDAASDTGAAHPERSLSVLPSGGAVVMGDRDQLRRALVNLLNNAALHTAPGGPIRLEGVVGSTSAGPTVAIRVIDQGPGLPPEEAAHVFERFWRADKARSRAKGGSGLGMAIVAQIVKANNGTVTFDSTEQAGTTVTVLLPMAFEQPPLPTAE